MKWIVAFMLLSLSMVTRAQTIEYVHTDPLGSPVAITNQAGQVIERMQYEPYGANIGQSNSDRPGYTGHVMDSQSGLTYMQQRYYDPTIGRFLSTDPVTANSVTGANFNRFWYANNNPYRFTDPDGREGKDNGPNSPKVDEDSLTRRERAENRKYLREIKSALSKLGDGLAKKGEQEKLRRYKALTVRLVGSPPEDVVRYAEHKGIPVSQIMGYEQAPNDGIVTFLPALGQLSDPEYTIGTYHGMELGKGSQLNIFKGITHEIGHEFDELWFIDPDSREERANEFVREMQPYYTE